MYKKGTVPFVEEHVVGTYTHFHLWSLIPVVEEGYGGSKLAKEILNVFLICSFIM